MGEAVAQAAGVARSGDVVLLSPGGTSYDMYSDFEARGRDFARAVSELPQ
jgi:UDP-N-acetylmuramoylalanine--D-glutamate ligase